MLNLVAPLEMALRDGTHPLAGRVGPRTGDPRRMADYEAFASAYRTQLAYLIDKVVEVNDLLGARLRALWADGSRRVRFSLRYREREYPRAFIFDNTVNPGTGLSNPNKAYDIFDAAMRGELPLFGGSNFFAEAEWRLQEAADPRYTYDRLRIGAGLEWGF